MTPSWAQVMKYPDISLQEQQLPDGVKPDIDCSLRLYGERLYRGITLTKCGGTHTSELEAFIATNGAGRSAILRPHAPVSMLLQFPIIEFDSTERYVLIDLQPRNKYVGFQGFQGFHSVVCRELTAWKPPRNDWGSNIMVEELNDPDAYQYMLRRVTTLECEKPGLLPFAADLQSPTLSRVPLALHDDNRFEGSYLPSGIHRSL